MNEASERDLTTGIPDLELREGEMIAGRLGEEQILLVRSEGEVFAVSATCTHYGGPLVDGIATGRTIRCPWHHACFDLKSGAVLRAPALAPLSRWRVERRGDRLFVGERLGATTPSPSAGPESVVIVGAGAAGVNVADTLRSEGYSGRIILISREADLPYDRPNLSKDFLAGQAPAEWLPLHSPQHYEEQRIELRLGVTVSSVDASAAKCVVTSSGERIPFGALVLATGASARELRMGGAERVHYLRTRRDAEALVAKAASARRAVVIGSSFIGLETAASLRQKGLDVIVTSPDRIPLERVLGAEVGQHIRSVHEKHGIAFRLGRSVVGLDASGVLLDGGEHLDGDLVVAGIGVSPMIELAAAAGIATADGIVVNEYLETSMSGVYACGDVASWPDARNERMRVEHWVVAGRQGQTVARNILGKRERFSAVPFFWSAHFDTIICYVGHAVRWDAMEIEGSLEANDATIVYRLGDRVQAIATIGRDRVSLHAEQAMEHGLVALTEFKAASTP